MIPDLLPIFLHSCGDKIWEWLGDKATSRHDSDDLLPDKKLQATNTRSLKAWYETEALPVSFSSNDECMCNSIVLRIALILRPFQPQLRRKGMGMRLTYQPPSSGPEGLEPSCAEARGCPLSLKKG